MSGSDSSEVRTPVKKVNVLLRLRRSLRLSFIKSQPQLILLIGSTKLDEKDCVSRNPDEETGAPAKI